MFFIESLTIHLPVHCVLSAGANVAFKPQLQQQQVAVYAAADDVGNATSAHCNNSNKWLQVGQVPQTNTHRQQLRETHAAFLSFIRMHSFIYLSIQHSNL